MFSKEIIDAIVKVAKKEKWPASALLAVVECETSGEPFENDGKTPRFLFERHKFYSELKAHQPGKLNKAIAAGLAIPKWSRKTQYKDQGTSAGRMAVIAKARAIDEEVANRAASWGLGQTMGFNAERLGYESATAMVAILSKGIDAQIDSLAREIKKSNLGRHLIDKDFAKFARGYNGSGYKQNSYDTRMKAAEARWARRLNDKNFTPKPSKSITLVYQAKLKQLNYNVGEIDGDWGALTTGACSAFQRKEGLTVTGHPNDETTKHLQEAFEPAAVSEKRSKATAKDLRSAGSRTIKAADKGSLITKILVWTGIAGGAEQTGALDQAKDVVDQVQVAKGAVESLQDLASSLAPYWWVGVLIVGFFLWRSYGDIVKARLSDHQSGLNVSR